MDRSTRQSIDRGSRVGGPETVGLLARGSSNGRVLVYHQTEPSHFLRQIDEISRKFEFVDISSAIQRMQGRPPADARNCFALVTFDDGHRDFLDVMDDLLLLRVPACLYITRRWLGRPGYLQASEVRSISQGFDVGSHTLSHPRLLDLDESQIAQELEGSRHYLEDLIGKPVVHFAAPFGGPSSFDLNAMRVAGRAGYKTFRTTFRGWNRPKSREYSGLQLLRADVVRDWYPSWRLRLTLAGALDWRAWYRLRNR